MKFNNIPIYRDLMKYINEKNVPFHMPGHKMGLFYSGLSLKNFMELDLTELPGTDNLHDANSCINEAQTLASIAFGADETFFLVNGTTSGIHAAILSCCNMGDKVIMARDCHKSVYTGIILAGAIPIYFYPNVNKEYYIPEDYDELEIKNIIENNSDAKCIVLTRPTYYGVCYNIKKISKLAKQRNIIVIIDEAHGAHLRFSRLLPKSALELGADITIQSAHKTLPALTQTSYLHIKKGLVDVQKLKFYLTSLQSSSPSFVLLTYLDMARDIMEIHGERELKRVLECICNFKQKIQDIEGVNVIDGEILKKSEFDSTRLVINTYKSGITGIQFENILRREYKIQMEMSNLFNMVAICTISDSNEFYNKLFDAIRTIIYNNNKSYNNDTKFKITNFKTNTKLSLRDTLSKSFEQVFLKDAIGRISKEFISPYPPGIPLICPGEVITFEIIEYIEDCLNNGIAMNGIRHGNIVEVVM